MIKEKEGNILKSKEDVICHQVNCKGVMGAGLAKQIREKYPETYKEYRKKCIGKGDTRELLGDILICEERGKIIANLFGQDGYGRYGTHTDYKALEKGLREVKKYAEENNLTVSNPYGIGCGLAGGDWSIVSGIIEAIYKGYGVSLYRYQ